VALWSCGGLFSVLLLESTALCGALSRRRTENNPPHDHNATPAANNPPPPFHK